MNLFILMVTLGADIYFAPKIELQIVASLQKADEVALTCEKNPACYPMVFKLVDNKLVVYKRKITKTWELDTTTRAPKEDR